MDNEPARESCVILPDFLWSTSRSGRVSLPEGFCRPTTTREVTVKEFVRRQICLQGRLFRRSREGCPVAMRESKRMIHRTALRG